MAEATTPKPNDGEATTPEGGEAITSGEPKQEQPATPEQLQTKVAELEGQVGTLSKQLEEQRTLQSQADRKRKVVEIERKKLTDTLAKIRSGEISSDEEIMPNESSLEKENRLTARIKIQNLLLENSDYQELLKKDLTLKEVLKNNPFALIGDYLDSDDAAEQIRERLDTMVSSLSKPNPKEEKKEGEGPEFNAGLTQPKEGLSAPASSPIPQTPDEKLEESIKSKIKIG